MPSCLNSLIAAALVDFSTSATAITPIICLLRANISGVFPSSANLLIVSLIGVVSIRKSSRNFSFPAKYLSPSHSASTPLPNVALKFFIDSGLICLSLANLTIASANGCSLPISSPQAISIKFFESKSFTTNILVT